ncbi:MAG: glycosyltransferase family 2 protein [Chlorobi bacterium]|nr:glycosyltransferase family 2 protein [Chlorobiota bacterium]MCI0716086.1 glycosyltransferase family 2 protein [Chlorobiota bacterium]
MANQSWSIIVFGYNEGATVGNVINSVIEFCLSNGIGDYEIIAVDDGSTDNSYDVIKSLSETHSVIKPVRNQTNLGIGPTMLKGYKASQKENVIAIPADGQFKINELGEFKDFDDRSFLSFQREQKDYTLYRRLVSYANRMFNLAFLSMNVKDVNWVKAYKNKDLQNIELMLNSSLINSEICSKLQIMNYKIHEIPSVYHNRVSGRARGASLKTISQAVVELLKLAFIIRKFRKKIK